MVKGGLEALEALASVKNCLAIFELEE